MRFLVTLIAFLVIFANSAFAEKPSDDLIKLFMSHDKSLVRVLIKIENKKDGLVQVFRPNRDNEWISLGKVLLPTEKVNINGFTASSWGHTGTLIASAVNAHHIKSDQDLKTGKGVVFSLLPRERKDTDPKQYQSYLSPDSSIYTDIMAGTGIFGGGFTPAPGSPVFYQNQSTTTPSRLPKGYIPKVDDTLFIVSSFPELQLDYIEFENRFGGLIVANIPSLQKVNVSSLETSPMISNSVDVPEFRYNLRKANIPNMPKWLTGEIDTLGRFVLGTVYKPVQGSGRFLGSTFAYEGRIRAVHPGVLCISSSPLDVVGGFQIIPHHHGNSTEMVYARQLTQWMVIGPENAFETGFEGESPFFYQYFYPSYIPNNDAYFTDDERFSQRFLIQVKLEGKDEWVILPKSVERVDNAFEKVTHIRIYLPVFSTALSD